MFSLKCTLFLIIFLCLPGLLFAEASGDCPPDHMCVSDFEIVATETEVPYRRNGGIKEGSARHNAILKYADPVDCLVTNKNGQKNIVSVIWRSLNIDEVQVCIFRIAASLRSKEKIAIWLKSEGFIGVAVRDFPGGNASPSLKNAYSTITGSWDHATGQSKIPSFLGRLSLKLVRGSSVSIFQDDSENVIAAVYSTSSILN